MFARIVFDRESLRDPQGNGPLVGDEATTEWQVSHRLVRVRVAAIHGERLVDEIDGGVPGAAGVLLLEVLLALEAEGGVERLEHEEEVLRVVADGRDEVVDLEHLRLHQGLERDLGDLVAERRD